MTKKTALQSIAKTEPIKGLNGVDAVSRLSSVGYSATIKVLASLKVYADMGYSIEALLDPQAWAQPRVDLDLVQSDDAHAARACACDAFIVEAMHGGYTIPVDKIINAHRRFN